MRGSGYCMIFRRYAVALTLTGTALMASCVVAQTATVTTTSTQTITTGSNVTATVSNPVATSVGRIANGFEFTVTVSNVHPLLGESVIINARLLNLYNATIPIDQLYGKIVLQIADENGNIVWKEIDDHPPVPTTTPAPPAGTGYNWDFTRAWTAGGNYMVPMIPVTGGSYTLSASTTLFGLEVTPIRITVSDWLVGAPG
jgi:hypothetical protein